nr:hypothetical protein [Gemmatimonadaceae bacterium]
MKRVSLALITVLAAGSVTTSILHAQVRTTPQGMALNFVDARLADVVRSLALSLGLNVVLTDVPDKRITFTTATAVDMDGVNAILESILESNGLVLIQKGAVAQVMPVGRAPAQSARTYVMTLKYASAEDLAASLGKLFGNTVVTGDTRSLDDKSLS